MKKVTGEERGSRSPVFSFKFPEFVREGGFGNSFKFIDSGLGVRKNSLVVSENEMLIQLEEIPSSETL